ncbi:MAG: hypothetical protein AB1607_08760 [Chloroflexota bacterium]
MTAVQNSTTVQHSRYLRVALQSALASALFLGFPAGLLLWLVLFRESSQTSALNPFVNILQANGANKIIVLTICSSGWSFVLGRISGYRAWGRIGFATALGIIVAWFSPLSNLDGWLADGTPIHTLYAWTMSGLVGSVTLCAGLAYGIILRSAKAALTISITTSLVSVLALLLTIFAFDQFGIRVGGEVPFAMSKVTTVSLMMSAITGGAVFGVVFSRFVQKTLKTQ